MNKIAKKLSWSIPGILVFSVDQLIKCAIRKMPMYTPFFTIPGVAELIHCTNTGAAFSLMQGKILLISSFSVALVMMLLWLFVKSMHLTAGSMMALSVMIGGGGGNLFDRVFRSGVTDYIRLLFVSFPVFNFADICITLSVLTLIFYLITGRLDKHPEEKHGSDH